ncbi:MAG TPA: serine protease [Stenomitos sp.]
MDNAPTEQSPQSSRSGVALTPNNLQSLQRYARAITVKVMSDDNWGSGILIRQQGKMYTVLTNQHVLWIGDRYIIQTSDGKTFNAQRAIQSGFGKNDLGMLQFTNTATAEYPVAKLGCSLQLSKGTPVFAAGFPLPLNETSTKGFKFTTGAISLISPKAFEGGYQVGYSNNIEKGMSGGPVLNAKGEVIAINGMHQEPLWGDPYIFQDGSKPNAALFPVLSHSSWGIPVETALKTSALTHYLLSDACPAKKQVIGLGS